MNDALCTALPATVYAYGHSLWFHATREARCRVLPMIRITVCEVA